MSYTVQQIKDLPAPTIVATLSDPYNAIDEAPQMVNELDRAVAKLAGDPIFVVADLTALSLDLETIIQGLAAAFVPRKDISTQNLDADRVRTIMIGTSSLMKLAAKAGGQDQYGNRSIELYPTLDAALEQIRHTTQS